MSFNTFGKTAKSYGGGKNIWHEITGKYPVGGTISNLADFAEGTVIPAGSMVVYNSVSAIVKIVKATDSGDLANVNGLTENDVYVDAAVKSKTGNATVAVVFAGTIYSSRLAEEVPAEVWANLPEIKQFKEA